MACSGRRLHGLLTRLMPAGVATLALALCCAPAASAASPPSVSILKPEAAATVQGTVTVEATATASPGDYPTHIAFFDGATQIGVANCPGLETCVVSIEWHATGLSGPHSLTATAQTNEGQHATSAAVAVSVVSPPPTAKVTSPAAGATVAGTVAVSVEAATDPSQEDYPRVISVFDGSQELGLVNCPGQETCQGQVSWRATGLSGTHTLTAAVSTNRGVSATSVPVAVTVVSPPPMVTITQPAAGTPLAPTMTVAATAVTDPSQDDYPIAIGIFDGNDEIGRFNCQGQPTCSVSGQWNTTGLKGVQVLHATVHTNRGREAPSAPVSVGVAPPARASCRLSSKRVRARHQDTGRCTVHGPPAGTSVAVQYRIGSGPWRTRLAGRIPHDGQFLFTFHQARRGPVQLSVLISAAGGYAQTRVSLGTLHVT
jgi:hypothetical protein